MHKSRDYGRILTAKQPAKQSANVLNVLIGVLNFYRLQALKLHPSRHVVHPEMMQNLSQQQFRYGLVLPVRRWQDCLQAA